MHLTFLPISGRMANCSFLWVMVLGTHELLEILTSCFQNHIVFYRLPSHTLHRLDPCARGVFGSLRTACRERAEPISHGDANIIRKTALWFYNEEWQTTFRRRNRRASRSKAG
ncbi:hypothetical protein M433DRAFT_470616 [Acidomyces richmondensis BFW]|nr:MAG: hypothetical protein FE78DRAFT_104429 [Acidomyces sp. 'richmondensis']KYG47797.1 hypothetical protein M433DRAFT_470616 [Acidomyces richmondensis BFW]